MRSMDKDEHDGMEEDEGEGEDDDSSSDDSGSASGEDEAEEDDEELILLLQARLQTCNGRDYKAHAQLVKCLKEQGELKKLEKAREHFSEMFPLTPEMWLEWISDEGRLAVTDADHKKITQLFERSVADYNSPRLWENYMEYSQKRYKERGEDDPARPKLLSEARQVADRAVLGAGCHLTLGQRLWESQRAFELEILAGVSSGDAVAVATQMARVRGCFLNQLATPGRGLERAWEAYESWEQEASMAESVKSVMEKQVAKCADRETHEAAVEANANDPEALLASWQAYVNYEEKQNSISRGGGSGNTAALLSRTPSTHSLRERERVRCIYERAVLQCCLYPVIWQAYADWELAGPEPSRAQAIYQRAVRNCPFSADLWVSFALFTEEAADFSHAGGPDEEDKVEAVYVTAGKEVTYYSPTMLRQLSLARCDFVRRRFLRRVPAGVAKSNSEDVEEERRRVRADFEELAAALTAKEDEAGARAVLLYLGELEALLFSKMPRAMEVWDAALKGCTHDADAWLSVVDLLRAMRYIGPARSLLKRGVNALQVASKENPKGTTLEGMLSYVARWLDFERREGDVETYKVALAKYSSVASLLPATSTSGNAPGAPGASQRKDKKKKQDGDSEDPVKVARREEVMRKWAERKAAAEGGAAVAASGESKKSKRAREEGPKADQRDDSAAKRAKTGAQDINAASGCSVFVQNLAPDVTDDALRAHFVQFGPVANCRVVRDKMGASKGFGYVDFSAADGAGSALAAQGEQLQLAGRCVELSRARPLKADDKDKHGPSSRTLFVSGIAPSVSRETLRALFAGAEHAVVDVRMMRDREGNLRGFCYIEFEDEAGAQAGLSKDKSMLEGRQLRVAFSDPSRGAAGGGRGGTGGGGGGRGDGRGGRGGGGGVGGVSDGGAARGRGRSMLAMVPRAAMGRGGSGAESRGAPKVRPGLGSTAGRGKGGVTGGRDGVNTEEEKGQSSIHTGGSSVAGVQGGEDKSPVVKDNNFFRTLFSSGGNL